jgi:hypothetical protein
MENPSGGKKNGASRLVDSQGVDRADFNTIPYQKEEALGLLFTSKNSAPFSANIWNGKRAGRSDALPARGS